MHHLIFCDSDKCNVKLVNGTKSEQKLARSLFKHDFGQSSMMIQHLLSLLDDKTPGNCDGTEVAFVDVRRPWFCDVMMTLHDEYLFSGKLISCMCSLNLNKTEKGRPYVAVSIATPHCHFSWLWAGGGVLKCPNLHWPGVGSGMSPPSCPVLTILSVPVHHGIQTQNEIYFAGFRHQKHLYIVADVM